MKKRKTVPGLKLRQHKLQWVIRNHVHFILDLCEGHIGQAADVLGVDRMTVSRHLSGKSKRFRTRQRV